jgi:hypothetical protein
MKQKAGFRGPLEDPTESIHRSLDREERKSQEAVADVLRPSVAVLCAFGSIAIHAEEYLSPAGHPFDAEAIKSAMSQPEVQTWITGMQKAAFLPVKRNL